MKTYINIPIKIILPLLILLSGCSYLNVDSEMAENLTIKEVFENPTYTRRWHANIFNCIPDYSEMGADATTGFTNIWSSLAGEITSSREPTNSIMASGYNAISANHHKWGTITDYIRQAMIFLENATESLGEETDKTYISALEMARMKDEAKFFIAYSYFQLFELYGPAPIRKVLADPSEANLDLERAPIDELIQYIDGLLEECLKSGALPNTIKEESSYNLNEIVRPTKLTVMALRARLWVYAASPLFNGGYPEALKLVNKDGTRLFPDYDPGKWQIAKKRLEELFDEAKFIGHQLYVHPNGAEESLYNLFQNYNDEILWAKAQNSFNERWRMECRTIPRDIYNSYGNIGVFQESVDAFFMKNGLTIWDENSGYKEDGFVDIQNNANKNKRIDKHIFNMYDNRDPRFYAAITYQGRSWHIQPTGKQNYGVYFCKGGGCDNTGNNHPKTGYLLYKFSNRKVLYTGTNPTQFYRSWILFRLADFYLYYAEVCNEINPNDANIILYLDLVRGRAGIPGYKELKEKNLKDIIGNQDLQRKAIHQERQVELFAEGNWYFDVRRWMKADDKDPKSMYQQFIRHGMDMNQYAAEFDNKGLVTKYFDQTGEGSYYNRVVIEHRAWNRAMILYPVPYKEMQKSELLVQNPGW